MSEQPWFAVKRMISSKDPKEDFVWIKFMRTPESEEVFATDTRGHTALSRAVENDQVDMVRELLKAGTVMDNLSKDFGLASLSPLMRACKQGYEAIALDLLKHGASIGILNEDNQNALDLLRSLETLRDEYGVDKDSIKTIEPAMGEAVQKRFPSLVEALRSGGCARAELQIMLEVLEWSPLDSDEYGFQPLDYADSLFRDAELSTILCRHLFITDTQEAALQHNDMRALVREQVASSVPHRAAHDRVLLGFIACCSFLGSSTTKALLTEGASVDLSNQPLTDAQIVAISVLLGFGGCSSLKVNLENNGKRARDALLTAMVQRIKRQDEVRIVGLNISPNTAWKHSVFRRMTMLSPIIGFILFVVDMMQLLSFPISNEVGFSGGAANGYWIQVIHTFQSVDFVPSVPFEVDAACLLSLIAFVVMLHFPVDRQRHRSLLQMIRSHAMGDSERETIVLEDACWYCGDADDCEQLWCCKYSDDGLREYNDIRCAMLVCCCPCVGCFFAYAYGQGHHRYACWRRLASVVYPFCVFAIWLSGVLFLPILRTSFAYSACREVEIGDTSCWTSTHLWLTIAIFVFLVPYGALCVRLARVNFVASGIYRVPDDHLSGFAWFDWGGDAKADFVRTNPFCIRDSSWNTTSIAFKAVLAAVSTALGEASSATNSVFAAGALVMVVVSVQRPSYFDASDTCSLVKWNAVRVACAVLLLFANILALAVSIEGRDTDFSSDATWVLVVGVIPVLLVSYTVASCSSLISVPAAGAVSVPGSVALRSISEELPTNFAISYSPDAAASRV